MLNANRIRTCVLAFEAGWLQGDTFDRLLTYGWLSRGPSSMLLHAWVRGSGFPGEDADRAVIGLGGVRVVLWAGARSVDCGLDLRSVDCGLWTARVLWPGLDLWAVDLLCDDVRCDRSRSLSTVFELRQNTCDGRGWKVSPKVQDVKASFGCARASRCRRSTDHSPPSSTGVRILGYLERFPR